MKLAAQTISSEVVDRLNRILHRGVYASPNEFDVRFLKRELEKLRDADVAFGWALFGSYNVLLGDLSETERCFSASFRLASVPAASGNYHASLCNLGYFNRAHHYFVEKGRPELGILSHMRDEAASTGSFQTAVAYSKEAESMGIALGPELNDRYVRAAKVLANAGVSDDDVTRHLDFAGEVLRRHKLFFINDIQVNVSDVDGEFIGVTCVLNVRKSPVDAFELNVELAELEQEMGLQKNPAFDVMFLPL